MDARLRDILLFTAGLFILAHQTLVASSASPTLVGASLSMMIGAPAVYRFLDRYDKPADNPKEEGET